MRYPGKRYREFVVVYDITSDAERARVDKVLKNYGFRIQKSVFECKLNDTMKRNLLKDLVRLNIKTGFVKIYELTDIVDAQTVGSIRNTIDDGDAFIV